MGLRTAEGIWPKALAERLGVERLIDDAAARRLASLRLVEFTGERLRVTPSGRLVLDRILAEIAA